jgi:transcriptional regulator with XRE-family HTH domain
LRFHLLIGGAHRTVAVVHNWHFPRILEDPVTTLDVAIDEQARRLGRRIRELRGVRGLTLVQLAELAELSHPFLSQLERGLARPSMTSLEKIARALGSSQLELLAGADEEIAGQAAMVLVRKQEGPRGQFASSAARMLVTGKRPFQPMEVRGDNLESGAYFTHAEDEFVHVLEGTVVVELQGHDTAILNVGDSLYYVGGTPHRWTAIDAAGYRLIVVKEKPQQL